jgi:mandelamide amidase
LSGLAELLAWTSLPLTLYEAPRDLAIHLAAYRCPLSVGEVVEQMAGPVERGWLAEEIWDKASSTASTPRSSVGAAPP